MSTGLLEAIKGSNSIKSLAISMNNVPLCTMLSHSIYQMVQFNKSIVEIDLTLLKVQQGDAINVLKILTDILQTHNNSICNFLVYYGTENKASLYWESQLQYATFHNLAGRKLLSSDSYIPPGLWPIVLGRIKDLHKYQAYNGYLPEGSLNNDGNYDVYSGYLSEESLNNDAVFHLLRNSPIFQSCLPSLANKQHMA